MKIWKRLFGMISTVGTLVSSNTSLAQPAMFGIDHGDRTSLEFLKQAFLKFSFVQKVHPEIGFTQFLSESEGFSEQELNKILQDNVTLHALEEFAKIASSEPFKT